MPLRLEHISKTYGKQQVLKDVSLSMQDGEIVGLLGPNGAGKSTLMKVMVGLVKPDGAAAPVRPLRCWKLDRCAVGVETAGAVGSEIVVEVPERVGYLPEQNPLYEEMYVREYLSFIYDLTIDELRLIDELRVNDDLRMNVGKRQLRRKEQIKERVEELIRRVGLTEEAHKKIGQLSKGYRQRVGLAQALLSDPDLLVLDEPTTGLDPNQLVEIRSLIKHIGRDRMVILSTHILSEVKEICDRVVVLDHGEIKANLSISEITDLNALFQELTLKS